MKEKRVLREAADLIEKVGWCQEVDALDGRGIATTIWNPDAVAYCATGAVEKVCGVYSAEPEFETETGVTMALDRLWEFLPWNGDPPEEDAPVTTAIASWNDTAGRTAREVINAMRRAAE